MDFQYIIVPGGSVAKKPGEIRARGQSQGRYLPFEKEPIMKGEWICHQEMLQTATINFLFETARVRNTNGLVSTV